MSVLSSLLISAVAAELPLAELPVAEPAAVVAPQPDRSERPAVVPPEPLELAEPEEHAIGDVRVLLVPLEGARKVEVRLIQQRGSLDLAGGPTPTTAALGWLQDGATQTRPPDVLAQESDVYDVSVTSWMSLRNSGVDMVAPRGELDRGLDMLADVLREPAFLGKEMRRYRRETLRWYEVVAATDARTVASNALNYAWFGAEHPFGARPDLDAWRRLKRGPILDLHERLLAESPLTVLVVGDITWAELEPTLTPVVAGLGTAGTDNPDPAFTPPTASRIVAVEMPGAEQATLRLRMAAPLRDEADRVAAEAIDFALGGSFLSRLNRNLREEKGLTYGAGSSYHAGETRGYWTVHVDVQVADAALAMREIEAEIGRVAAEGVTAEEIGSARNAFVADWNQTRQTATTAAGFYETLHFDEDSAAEVRARLDALGSLTPADTQRAAATWWGPDRARVWVVTGDRAALEPQLAAIGAPVQWITAQQAVLGDL